MYAATNGFVQSLLTFLALGLGLAFVRLLFDKNWLFDQDTQVMKNSIAPHICGRSSAMNA